MLNRKSSSWFYPKPTGDPGRDRNARTLQITCLLFALTIGIMAAVDAIAGEREPLPILDLLAVAALGVAEKHGLTRAIPRVRTPTSYESIFFVDLVLLVFATVGSRIVRDSQRNIFDLRATIDRLSAANRDFRETAGALRESQQQLVSIYDTVRDVIFHLAAQPIVRARRRIRRP